MRFRRSTRFNVQFLNNGQSAEVTGQFVLFCVNWAEVEFAELLTVELYNSNTTRESAVILIITTV